jgi:polyvinyl alcohol dehydrogenase (cytochrome)
MKVLMKWLMAMTLCGVASVSSAVGVIENSSAASESIAEAASGASLFQNNCLHCHNGSVPKAPHAISFNMMSTASIVTAISEGVMRQQAAHLSQEERVQIARYLSESVDTASEEVKACDSDVTPVLAENEPGWSGWGGGIRNQRFQDADSAGLGPDTVGELELKWAFAYPGATRARSQPLVHGNTVFVGSQKGTVYALDLTSGCAHWQYEAGAEVRNGITVAMLENQSAPVLFFGDFKARVHAVSARTGAALWKKSVGTHADATITGSVKYHEQRLYVPISSSEWATAADPGYPCCTFRGSVAALDANDGSLFWNSFVIPTAPQETGETNPAGAKRMAPAGAPVWNSPTIDAERGLLYVGTGEGYTSPAVTTSDAVVAMRLEDGGIVWSQQLLAGDAWNMACFIGGGGNCPEENGPDLDIGAATILWRGDARDLLFVGQKSGDVYALDPNAGGQTVWHKKLGRGGYAGGVHWGMTANQDALFVPIADTHFPGLPNDPAFPGLHALDPLTGEVRWYAPALDECPENRKPACDPGLSAAATSSNQLIFTGGFDGLLRAYNATSGEVLWKYNSLGEFDTVSGELGRGGSIESDGPVVANGHLLVNSGYQFGSRMPGNVLLVFGLKSTEVAEVLASE